MKKFVKLGLVLGMLVATLGANAANVANITLSVVKENAKTINLVVEDASDVKLVIRNEQGTSVYSEVISSKKGKVSKTYDLKYLPSGNYTLEAETATKLVTYNIDLADTTTVVENAVKEVFKPILFTKEGKVMLQLLNLEKAPVNVTIYDVNNNVLYTQEFEGEINFSKKFALKKTFSSSYTFVISYADKSFTEEIAL